MSIGATFVMANESTSRNVISEDSGENRSLSLNTGRLLVGFQKHESKKRAAEFRKENGSAASKYLMAYFR